MKHNSYKILAGFILGYIFYILYKNLFVKEGLDSLDEEYENSFSASEKKVEDINEKSRDRNEDFCDCMNEDDMDEITDDLEDNIESQEDELYNLTRDQINTMFGK